MVYLFEASPRRTWQWMCFSKEAEQTRRTQQGSGQVWHTHSQEGGRVCACVGAGVPVCAGCARRNSPCPALWNWQKYPNVPGSSAPRHTQSSVSSVSAAARPSQRLLECCPHPRRERDLRFIGSHPPVLSPCPPGPAPGND